MRLNELYEFVLNGDKNAEDELFKFLSVRFRLISYQRIWDKVDSEDVAQEALMTVAKEFRNIKITTSFSAWAGKVLDNRILTYIRIKNSRQGLIDVLKERSENTKPNSPNYDLKRRLLNCFKKVGTVSKLYIDVLNLHGQGYSTKEVCTKLKISPNNSYVTLSRARSLLEKCLESGDIK